MHWLASKWKMPSPTSGLASSSKMSNPIRRGDGTLLLIHGLKARRCPLHLSPYFPILLCLGRSVLHCIYRSSTSLQWLLSHTLHGLHFLPVPFIIPVITLFIFLLWSFSQMRPNSPSFLLIIACIMSSVTFNLPHTSTFVTLIIHVFWFLLSIS